MKSSWKFGGAGGLAAVTITAVLTGLYLEPEPASELRDAQEAATGAPQQQIAKPDTSPEKEIEPVGPSTGGGGETTIDEICRNGMDDDGDGIIDETPPPRPGVNWNRCDVSGDDYTGENLRGATMFRIIAEGTTFNEADLSNVHARGGDFSNASFHNADVRNASFNAITTADRIETTEADFSGSSFNDIEELRGFFYETNLMDTTFFGTTTEKVRLHDASIQLANFRGAIVSTGIFEDDESFDEHWWYNADTTLDCINHVICNNPPPELFRDIYQVEPEPGTFRDVKINFFESWSFTGTDIDGDYWNCSESRYTCYFPQVATIVAGGTVNWIYDKYDVPAVEDPIRKLIIEPESEDLRSFSSPNIEPGERWSHTFTMPGKYHYYDESNPDWVGQVIVFGKMIPGDPIKPNQDPPPTENPPKNPPKNPPENPPN